MVGKLVLSAGQGRNHLVFLDVFTHQAEWAVVIVELRRIAHAPSSSLCRRKIGEEGGLPTRALVDWQSSILAAAGNTESEAKSLQCRGSVLRKGSKEDPSVSILGFVCIIINVCSIQGAVDEGDLIGKPAADVAV